MSRILLALLALLPTAVVAQPDTASRRPLEVDDLFRLKRVADPQLSPDGGWVAYTVTETRLADEKVESRVWMVPLAGGEAILMTAGDSSASRPRWSPDGKYLSFLAARGDLKPQVWGLDRRGGEAVPLTDVKQGVTSYEWSPDGKRLLLAIKDPEEADTTASDRKPTTRPPWVIDRLQFKRDSEGYLTGNRRTHLYVFDLTSRSLTPITSGRFDEEQAVWSPDGRRVAFVSNRTDNPDGNDNSDIWVVAADNTDRGATLTQVTTNPGADEAPAWSPDGVFIAYVSSLDPAAIWYATRHLAVAPATGGPARVLTQALDRNVSSPVYAPDGKAIYVELEESAEDHLARIEIATARITRPIDGPLSVGAFDIGSQGGVVALVATLEQPGEVQVLERGGLRRLTRVNDSLLGQLRLGEARTIQFPSADGTAIEAIAYFPPEYRSGTRYPTVLRLHGGPASQYTHAFSFEARLFAAHGYVVLTPNPRGSTGYGQAFSQALWADWGNLDYQDVMAAVDYAIAQGWSDPDRLGVGGWSYGGILTNYVITKTTRFRAAITGASEVLYVANYGHDHYQREWEAELGLPWKARETWERLSPFNAVDRIETPTLIMGGESDWNVPILNSEQLYQVLRRRGVPTQLVVYPGQPHGIRVPSYQKDRYERYLAWYGRYLGR